MEEGQVIPVKVIFFSYSMKINFELWKLNKILWSKVKGYIPRERLVYS